MDFILDNIGIFLMILGISHAISSIFIINALSRNGYNSSVMTPIANIRKLRNLSKFKKEYKSLYFLSLGIGYFALLTLILFIIVIIVEVT